MLVDELAEWKINEIQLYTEHTFAYRNHRDVWERASPMALLLRRGLRVGAAGVVHYQPCCSWHRC